MQALDGDQRIEVLERKIDEGFADMRADFKAVRSEIRIEVNAARGEARADFRTMMALVSGLWATTALAVVGILIGHA